MAFTARIGWPEPRSPNVTQRQAAQNSSVVFRYVLQAAVTQDGRWAWMTVAIANSQDELTRFLSTWLSVASNKQIFTGQTRVELVPDISSTK